MAQVRRLLRIMSRLEGVVTGVGEASKRVGVRRESKAMMVGILLLKKEIGSNRLIVRI